MDDVERNDGSAEPRSGVPVRAIHPSHKAQVEEFFRTAHIELVATSKGYLPPARHKKPDRGDELAGKAFAPMSSEKHVASPGVQEQSEANAHPSKQAKRGR